MTAISQPDNTSANLVSLVNMVTNLATTAVPAHCATFAMMGMVEDIRAWVVVGEAMEVVIITIQECKSFFSFAL